MGQGHYEILEFMARSGANNSQQDDRKKSYNACAYRC